MLRLIPPCPVVRPCGQRPATLGIPRLFSSGAELRIFHVKKKGKKKKKQAAEPEKDRHKSPSGPPSPKEHLDQYLAPLKSEFHVPHHVAHIRPLGRMLCPGAENDAPSDEGQRKDAFEAAADGLKAHHYREIAAKQIRNLRLENEKDREALEKAQLRIISLEDTIKGLRQELAGLKR